MGVEQQVWILVFPPVRGNTLRYSLCANQLALSFCKRKHQTFLYPTLAVLLADIGSSAAKLDKTDMCTVGGTL